MKMVERIIEKYYKRTGKMRRSEPAAFCEECNDNGEENYRKILQENSQDETFRACSSIV